MTDLTLIVSTGGVFALGLCAIIVALIPGHCAYRRETLLGVGLYLVCAGIVRLAAAVGLVGGADSRAATGYLAIAAVMAVGHSSVAHWLIHRWIGKDPA